MTPDDSLLQMQKPDSESTCIKSVGYKDVHLHSPVIIADLRGKSTCRCSGEQMRRREACRVTGVIDDDDDVCA